MSELSDTIKQNAQGPQKVENATEAATQHPLPYLIAADRYLASKTAMASKGLGIKVTKARAPGAV